VSESVEQAALLRATTDPRVISALESVKRIIESDGRMHKMLADQCSALGQEIDTLHDENAELRDSLLALSNRIEAVSRTLASRTDHLA
jgi:predicted  nucleic acid-binding Zn-ribbon protein